ncbi:MAG: glutamine--tRNA ligase/YqeY domain fusion protein [Bacillota bacterium]|nr:glutamine--tRNA ligase/YqeY domain fusion protein [Bacillota bacterium]
MSKEIEIEKPRHFIAQIIDEDMAPGGRTHGQRLHTRFPPEPNGYLHIGHAKAVVINFGLAEAYDGLCNLRMDDTNPLREEEHYVDSIVEDIRWLGYDWEERFYFASDYFERMYDCAVALIRDGKAYVCELDADELRRTRGTLTEPGTNSPWRDRPVEESLKLFAEMRAGQHEDGRMVLRAKIDMASGNMNMRDPVLYRISHAEHHRTGDAWCIYPMYDFAHPLEDAFEHITHSLCSIEFEDHRPLYDWVIDNCPVPSRPRQIEFARLGINGTVMSKRKLRQLVEADLVHGWDDPRLPTLRGLRRRGYTPTAIRRFVTETGVSKVMSTADQAFLEHCLRDELNREAPRVMAVVDPVRLTLTNWPEDETVFVTAENNPERPEDGTRELSFGRELWIEREDFMETPPRRYHRLYPGNEVRLKHACIIRCTGCVKDEDGRVTEVLAEVDFATKGGETPDGRRVRGTIHWVHAKTAVTAEVRLYDRLFTVDDPDADDRDYLEVLNPESLTIMPEAKVEPLLAAARPGENFQFLRLGYFTPDPDTSPERPVLNRAVSLKDSYRPPQS